MVKQIHLQNSSLIALVDEEDFVFVNQYKWSAVDLSKNKSGTFYVASRIANRTTYLHRMIMGEPETLTVDHVNRNPLDNRKSNLRLATPSQQQQNRGVSKKRTRFQNHGFKGVHRFNPETKEGKYPRCWMAHIQVNGRSKTLGRFLTAEEAARAYDLAAVEYFGEFAVLNFPEQMKEIA